MKKGMIRGWKRFTAAGIAAHAQEIQAAGGRYCDCPACAIVEEILAQKEEMLK